jgi:uncharacterized membrane protein YidH (DUF202 family)
LLQGDDGVTPGGQVAVPGMARERTELAWSRSGLSVAATVAVTLRRLWPLTGDKAVVALVLIAVGATIWAVGMQLARRSSLITHPGRRHSATSTFRLLTIGTLTLAAAGFVVGLVVPG